MKIYIKEQEVELKQSFRSYIIYEQITNKVFQPKTLTDFSIYFYCVILSSKQDIDLLFDEFMEWLDDNMESFNKFMEWIGTNNKINESTSQTDNKKKVN